MKVLPLPYFLPPPQYLRNDIYLDASGFGYDAKSRDYKVLRICTEYYREEADVDSYCGHKEHFELYSFKCSSWKEIPTPGVRISISSGVGVYVEETGSCYWTACVYGLPDLNSFLCCVVSFDFATESFDHFPIPHESSVGSERAMYKLVECRGSLGALVWWRNVPSVELIVRKGMSWDTLYVVSFADVRRALCLKDDRLLFLEAKPSGGRSQLMVYDLVSNTLKKLNIYDYPGHMSVISYAETTDTDPSLPVYQALHQ